MLSINNSDDEWCGSEKSSRRDRRLRCSDDGSFDNSDKSIASSIDDIACGVLKKQIVRSGLRELNESGLSYSRVREHDDDDDSTNTTLSSHESDDLPTSSSSDDEHAKESFKRARKKLQPSPPPPSPDSNASFTRKTFTRKFHDIDKARSPVLNRREEKMQNKASKKRDRRTSSSSSAEESSSSSRASSPRASLLYLKEKLKKYKNKNTQDLPITSERQYMPEESSTIDVQSSMQNDESPMDNGAHSYSSILTGQINAKTTNRMLLDEQKKLTTGHAKVASLTENARYNSACKTITSVKTSIDRQCQINEPVIRDIRSTTKTDKRIIDNLSSIVKNQPRIIDQRRQKTESIAIVEQSDSQRLLKEGTSMEDTDTVKRNKEKYAREGESMVDQQKTKRVKRKNSTSSVCRKTDDLTESSNVKLEKNVPENERCSSALTDNATDSGQKREHEEQKNETLSRNDDDLPGDVNVGLKKGEAKRDGRLGVHFETFQEQEECRRSIETALTRFLQPNDYAKDTSLLTSVLLCNYNKSQLYKVVDQLNELYDKKTSPVAIKWAEKFKRLLSTKNDMNTLDTHSIGLMLSIHLQSNESQKILNVKHIGGQFNVNDDELARNTIPDINVTILHKGNTEIWFRVKLHAGVKLETLLATLSNPPTRTFSFHNDIHEIYYSRTVFTSRKEYYKYCLNELNNAECVKRLIFFSDCRLLFKIESKAVQFSNNVSFLYCYLNHSSHNDLIVTCNSDREYLLFTLMLATLFLYKQNLNTVNKLTHVSQLITPLTALTGERSYMNIRKFIKDNDDGSFPYNVCNSRDGWITGIGSQIGDRNIHELIVRRDLQ